MIFLVQCAKKNALVKIFQRPQTALALRAREILLVFEKINLLVLIYSISHSKSCDYLY